MLARTIGRAAAAAGFILSGAVAWAQTDQKPAIPEALRQSLAQGAALCKANLGSAPPDLKLGEVEEFCTCMGVNEYAMQDMTNEAKASLRPRQQQMCMEIVRKQGPAPAPATTPAAPPSPPPAAPVTAEQPAASAPAPPAASQPPAVERFEQWTLNTNVTGAPVAYARATGSDTVAAFMMYCRAKDAIGLRVRYKGGTIEKMVGLNMAGDITEFATDKNGLVPQKSWADFVKFWLENEKHFTPERRKQPDYSGVMELFTSKRDIGTINLDGLGDARKRLLAVCADAIAKGAPEGNYITTGLVAFDTEVLVGSAPNGTPAGVAVVAPRAPTAAPNTAAREPKPSQRCNITEAQITATFTYEATQLRERVKAEFMRTGNLSNATACANMRRMNAFHQGVIKRVSACEAMPNRNKLITEHRGYIAKNNNHIRTNNWCG